MKIVCKAEHLSVQIGNSYVFMVEHEETQIDDEIGYQVLAKYPGLLARVGDELKNKAVLNIENKK